MTKYRLLGFLFFAILFSTPIDAQQRFKAGVIAGFNASQIDGDASVGYRKLGVVGGLRGVAILTNKTELSFELLFSQRGSCTEITVNGGTTQNRIHLNYVAIPVAFNYFDWEAEGYYRLHFHAGLSYGRLLGFKLDDTSWENAANEFNQNDLSFFAGATYYINEHIGITGRYSRSLILLFNNDKVTTVNSNSFLSHYLTAHVVYMF